VKKVLVMRILETGKEFLTGITKTGWIEMEWIYLAHCGDHCQATLNMELKLHAIKFAEFLIRGVTISLSINV